MVMEPKYSAEEVIGHPHHPLTSWLDPYRASLKQRHPWNLPFRELTYPPDKAYLKMIFLFPRWDMLISRRVAILCFHTIQRIPKTFAKKVRVVDMLQSKATICPCKMVPWIDMKQYGKVYGIYQVGSKTTTVGGGFKTYLEVQDIGCNW